MLRAKVFLWCAYVRVYVKRKIGSIRSKIRTRLLDLIRRCALCDGNARCGSPEGRNSKDNIKIASEWKKKKKMARARMCACVCPYGLRSSFLVAPWDRIGEKERDDRFLNFKIFFFFLLYPRSKILSEIDLVSFASSVRKIQSAMIRS